MVEISKAVKHLIFCKCGVCTKRLKLPHWKLKEVYSEISSRASYIQVEIQSLETQSLYM